MRAWVDARAPGTVPRPLPVPGGTLADAGGEATVVDPRRHSGTWPGRALVAAGAPATLVRTEALGMDAAMARPAEAWVG